VIFIVLGSMWCRKSGVAMWRNSCWWLTQHPHSISRSAAASVGVNRDTRNSVCWHISVFCTLYCLYFGLHFW